MSTLARQAYEDAMRLHRSGRLVEAESLYRQSLAAQPLDADALFMLGLLHHQTGRSSDATDFMHRAITIVPGKAVYHAHLGTALLTSGSVVAAIQSFRRAIELNPSSAEVHSNLASALLELGEAGDALASANIAMQLRPELAEAHYNRATALLQLKRAAEAIESFQRAQQLRPGYVEALNGLGVALQVVGRFEESVRVLQQAIALQPGMARALNNLACALEYLNRLPDAIAAYRQSLAVDPSAWNVQNNLAVALLRTGQLDQSIDECRRALQTNPENALLHYNLGNALKAKDAFSDAAAAYRRAIEINPEHFEALNNLGIVLQRSGQLDAAIDVFRAAMKLRPDAPEGVNLGNALAARGSVGEWTALFEKLLAAHPTNDEIRLDFSLSLLQQGNYERGWKEYEARLRINRSGQARQFKQPQWDGSNLLGKHILLHTEQGLGDAIQFIRFAPMVKARGGTLTLLCHAPLKRLFTGVRDLDNVIDDNDPLPQFDVHCPLMSLPKVFDTRVETIPANVRYLKADPARVTAWRNRLSRVSGKRVGLVWAGGQPLSRARSIPLALLDPLTRITGIQLISLQKGSDEIRDRARVAKMGIIDWADEFHDFVDTAALVECLDLVITVDTSLVHIAGGLAKPTWVMLPLATDWRWLRDRTDSPWYPTARLFRQQPRGGWEQVVADVAAALR